MAAERVGDPAGGADSGAARRPFVPVEIPPARVVRQELRVLAFANPVAPNADAAKLGDSLDQCFGETLHRVVETTGAKDFAAQVDRELRRAAEQGCDLVIAAGGDGTVSLIAERLHALGEEVSGMVLAIVPCGTANVLARELEIPASIEEAVAIAAERPRILPLDALALGDRLFLTQVGVGLDAYMILDTSRESQKRNKRFAYLAALLRRIFGHRSQSFRLDVDGRRIRVRAWQVLIANASTLGAKPFVWGPDIDPTDGVADLCIFQVQRLRDFVSLAWNVLTGQHAAASNARYLRVRRSVRVDTRRKTPVQGDGESLGETPIRLTVIPSAVQVVAPLAKADA